MTDDRTLARWGGLLALASDLVEHGSAAIQRVHLRTAERPFWILEQIPIVAVPARVVHVVHDANVTTVYVAIRIVNRVVRSVLDPRLTARRNRRSRMAAPSDASA